MQNTHLIYIWKPFQPPTEMKDSDSTEVSDMTPGQEFPAGKFRKSIISGRTISNLWNLLISKFLFLIVYEKFWYKLSKYCPSIIISKQVIQS